MNTHAKWIIAIASGTTACFAQTANAFVTKNPCDNKQHAIHCAYLTSATQAMKGKYIKLKEVKPGSSSTSMIFCAAPDESPLMNIPQYQKVDYPAGEKISWQFSQCQDENCSISKPLMDDQFTITAKGKQYSSAPRNVTEITLDANYGVDCAVNEDKKSTLKVHTVHTALLRRIDDVAIMALTVSGALETTDTLLKRMKGLAAQVASGGSTSLDTKFQMLKARINKAQEVDTFDGKKKVSRGTVSLHIGDWWDSSSSLSLNVPLYATDLDTLGVSYLDINSIENATYAGFALDYAITVVEAALNS